MNEEERKSLKEIEKNTSYMRIVVVTVGLLFLVWFVFGFIEGCMSVYMY